MTLKEMLIKHLKDNSGWHKKSSLYVVGENAGYLADTTSRKLRELAEEGTIKVEYYDGVIRKTKLARYSYDAPPAKRMVVTIEGGIAKISYK